MKLLQRNTEKFYANVLLKRVPSKVTEVFSKSKDNKSQGGNLFLEHSFLMEQKNSLQMCVGSVAVCETRNNLVSEADAAKKRGKIALSLRNQKSSNLQQSYAFGK